MSWVVSSGGTSVTFPLNPQQITDENPIIETDFQVDGQQSVLISEGTDIRVLTVKGFFYVATQNKAYLDTNFCTPLLSLNGGIVNLSTPTSRYNGYWVLVVKSIEEKSEGALQRYLYNILFKQGATALVL